MNDIAKKATADKFLRALEKEQLSKTEAGACIGFSAPNVSYLFNEKYWDRLGITYWDKLLAWVNSGQSLKEYSEKHGKVLTVKSPPEPKVTDPDTEKKETVPESGKTVPEPLIKIKHGVLEKRKEEIATKERRASRGEMVDMLIEEKESLRAKIEAIDVLLKHYIS